MGHVESASRAPSYEAFVAVSRTHRVLLQPVGCRGKRCPPDVQGPTAPGTFRLDDGRLVFILPRKTRTHFEEAARCARRLVGKRLVVDAGIDERPGHSRDVKVHGAMANAVLQIPSRIQHVRMPDHENVYTPCQP